MWCDASRIRRSVTEAISSSRPHGTTSGWLLVSGAWSRARIEATSRLPEPVCNPMELVPGSLEIIEKTPGAPGPARLRRVRTEE